MQVPAHGRSAPRVLLLHGMLAGAAHWDAVIDEMQGEADFLAVDVPGYGASPWPEGTPYTIDAVIDRLEPVVHEHAAEIVVGHSMGAVVALALAARLPDRLRAAGIAAMPVYPSWRDDPSVLAANNISRRLRAYSSPWAHSVCRIVQRASSLWVPFAPIVPGARPPAVLRAYFNHTKAAHYGSLREVVFAGLASKLADSLPIPVAALHGDRDRAAPFGPLRELANTHGWRLRTVHNGGHQTVLYRPRLAARWLREDVFPLASAQAAR